MNDTLYIIYRTFYPLLPLVLGQYMRSIAGDFNYIEFIANSKSGQFFFYSHDGMLVYVCMLLYMARVIYGSVILYTPIHEIVHIIYTLYTLSYTLRYIICILFTTIHYTGKYMIKTQTKEESRFVRAILPAYVDHVFRNPNSLLVRFYGMHRLV